MNRLNEIEARANAATEGPWEAGERCVFTLDGAPVISDDVVHYAHGMAGEGVCHEEDAEFIAHARADVPDMAAALRAVLELHVKARPITAAYGTQEGGDYCYSCAEDWPCPTVTAIRRYLGDDL